MSTGRVSLSLFPSFDEGQRKALGALLGPVSSAVIDRIEDHMRAVAELERGLIIPRAIAKRKDLHRRCHAKAMKLQRLMGEVQSILDNLKADERRLLVTEGLVNRFIETGDPRQAEWQVPLDPSPDPHHALYEALRAAIDDPRQRDVGVKYLDLAVTGLAELHESTIRWAKVTKPRRAKSGPSLAARPALEFGVACTLADHGVTLTKGRAGPLARVLQLTYEAAGYPVPTELFHVVKRLVDDPQVVARVDRRRASR